MFDITVEGNRPDAWSMAGVARDLAARLGLPFALPEPPAPRRSGRPVADAARAVGRRPRPLPAPDRLGSHRRGRRTVAGVDRPAPRPWPACGPINNVVDASNYVMLERGQPTHPYDLARLGGRGLVVRRAQPGEKVETLDGVTRTLGLPGRSLGDTGEDCLICDGDNVAGGDRRDHGRRLVGDRRLDHRGAARGGLLHAHGHRPDLQAPGPADRGLGAFRAGLRPLGDRRRRQPLRQLLGGERPGPAWSATASSTSADAVPEPFDGAGADRPRPAPDRRPAHRGARSRRSSTRSVPARGPVPGTGSLGRGAHQSARRAAGSVRDRRRHRGDRPHVRVRQHPPPHPDLAATGAPHVAAAVAPAGQERARAASAPPRAGPTRSSPRTPIAGSACGARPSGCPTPSWPKSPICAAPSCPACSARWRTTPPAPGVDPPVRGRRGVLPSRAGGAARRGAQRAGGSQTALLPGEREHLSAVFAYEDDDARRPRWRLARAGRCLPGARGPPGGARRRLRSIPAACTRPGRPGWSPIRADGTIGALGEIDPAVAVGFGLTEAQRAATAARRIGWLEVDLGLLFDEGSSPGGTRWPRR